MKLLKNFSLEKKTISKQDNMKEIMSFKSSNLIKNIKINQPTKTLETKKSLSRSFSSSSFGEEAEKTKRKINEINSKTIKINLADKKFKELKILSNTLSSDFFGSRKRTMKIRNIKTMFPLLSNNKSKKKELIYKTQLKKTNSPSNYNSNSLLNKWTENINKLFTKSLKKTRKEMYQILKKHKIQNIKKRFKIRNIPNTDINTGKGENNKDIINTFNSPKSRQNNNIESPIKNAFTFNSYNRPNNYLSSEYNSQSSISSRSINKFDYFLSDNFSTSFVKNCRNNMFFI